LAALDLEPELPRILREAWRRRAHLVFLRPNVVALRVPKQPLAAERLRRDVDRLTPVISTSLDG
jgi:hypothetical protein